MKHRNICGQQAEQDGQLQCQCGKEVYMCIVCNHPVEDYIPQMCCDGSDCGCQGLPIEPPLCNECSNIMYGLREII